MRLDTVFTVSLPTLLPLICRHVADTIPIQSSWHSLLFCWRFCFLAFVCLGGVLLSCIKPKVLEALVVARLRCGWDWRCDILLYGDTIAGRETKRKPSMAAAVSCPISVSALFGVAGTWRGWRCVVYLRVVSVCVCVCLSPLESREGLCHLSYAPYRRWQMFTGLLCAG